MKEFVLYIFLVTGICFPSFSQGTAPSLGDPLAVAKLIGDERSIELPLGFTTTIHTAFLQCYSLQWKSVKCKIRNKEDYLIPKLNKT